MYLKHHPAFKGKKLPKKFYEPFLVFKDGTAFSADNTITRILNKVFHILNYIIISFKELFKSIYNLLS